MNVHTPLQGRSALIACVIGILFTSIFFTPNVFAQTDGSDQYLRQIRVTLENTLNYVQQVHRIFATLDRDLSVSGSMREIQEALGNMNSSAQQLERIFTAFINDSQHDPTKRDFHNALIALGNSTQRLQALLQPQNISRVRALNLRDLNVAISNIIGGVERLKRLLSATGTDQDPPQVPDISLDQITLVFRHMVGNIHRAQTATHSIDSNGIANRESLREVLGHLSDAEEETNKFTRMLHAYGTTSDEKLRVIRNMLEISQQISSELTRLINTLTPDFQFSNTASGDFGLETFNKALNLIKSQLRDLRRGLKALMGENADGNPNTDPADIPTDDTLQRFDTDGDCTITTDEILYALELWVAKQINHRLFMSVVDAWVTGTAVCVATDPLGSIDGSSVISLKTSQTPAGISFRAQGTGVQTTEVAIYDANGAQILQERSAGSRLVWNLRNEQGHHVANGVYFYVVTFITNDGSVIRNEIRKLVIIR